MQEFNSNYLQDRQKEQLKKEQRNLRKTGVLLFVLAVVIMFISAVTYSFSMAVTGASAILGTIGGFMIARSYLHIKYQNIDRR